MKVIIDKRAQAYIKRLSDIDQGRILRYLDLLEAYGFNLPSRYFKKLRSNLWELRPGDIRLLLDLSRKKQTLVIVHVFKKKKQKIPKKEIKIAVTRIKECSV